MAVPPPGEVTRLLQAWQQGEQQALDELIPMVYGELRRQAHRCLARERPGHSLQTTALVNEAYLRLVGSKPVTWEGRRHFFGISARLMRQILVDYARSRRYLKRGGDARHVTFDEALVVSSTNGRDLVALDDALTSLAALDERKSHTVELRFFGGLSVEETADVLGVSPKTVKRDWKFAKAWLLRELGRARGGPPPPEAQA